MWEPYTASDLARLPAICTVDAQYWTCEVPLINFDIVEFHLPSRVLRQFGWEQHIPPICDTDQRLHRTSRRHAYRTGWPAVHARHIDAWGDRAQRIIRGVPTFRRLSLDSPYMVWYRGHSRVRLVREGARQTDQTGFQGRGSDYEFMVSL